MIRLHLEADITLANDAGTVSVVVDTDWSDLTDGDRPLVEDLMAALSRHDAAAGPLPAIQSGAAAPPPQQGVEPEPGPSHPEPAAVAPDPDDEPDEADTDRPITKNRERILRALLDAGGTVTDERGGAAAAVLELADVSPGHGRIVLRELEEAGHLSRDNRGNSRRTYRIAITGAGRAAIGAPSTNGHHEPIERRSFDPDQARAAAAAAAYGDLG